MGGALHGWVAHAWSLDFNHTAHNRPAGHGEGATACEAGLLMRGLSCCTCTPPPQQPAITCLLLSYKRGWASCDTTMGPPADGSIPRLLSPAQHIQYATQGRGCHRHAHAPSPQKHSARTHQALKGASHHSSRQQSEVNSNRWGVLGVAARGRLEHVCLLLSTAVNVVLIDM